MGCAPADRITADRPSDAGPAAGRAGDGLALSTRLPRDHYIRLDSNDYSVHPAVIGRRIEVVADLHRVRAFCDGRLVADHERIWGWHQTISDPEHVAAAKALRRERVGVLRPVPEPDVEQPMPGRLRHRPRPRRRGGVMAATTGTRTTDRDMRRGT